MANLDYDIAKRYLLSDILVTKSSMNNEEPADNSNTKFPAYSLEELIQIQARQWTSGERVYVEELLGNDRLQSLDKSPNDLMSLICQEVALRESQGEGVELAEYQSRFPKLADVLAIQWEIDRLLQLDSIESRSPVGSTLSGIPGPPVGLAALSRRLLPAKIDRYEILSELGHGAVGIVYKAWDPKLKRNVAIKRLRFGIDASDEDLQRIRSEAEAIAHVRHENVVQIFDVGEVDGQPFLAMELCLGGSLSHRLGGKPLSAKRAAELLQKIAAGISAAHENKVIHRDLKPSNVLLETETDWNPKVTDFGLAKLLDGEGLNTETGYVLGTPTYMPPEQASGGAKDATALMDVYSLGAILYECLTGRPPFRGLTISETLELVRNSEPISIRRLEPRVPVELETIASKCLRKVPEQRYATVRELIDDLQRFLDHRPIIAQRKNLKDHFVAWCRRNPALTGALAIILFLAIGSVAGLGWMNLRLLAESRKKSIALSQRTVALEEKSAALVQREMAYAASKQNERLANQHFYNARIGLAHQAILRNEMARAEDIFMQLDQTQAEFIGFEWHLLRNDLMRDLKWQSNDQLGEVMEVEFSKDDRMVLAVGGGIRDGYLRTFDADTGRILITKTQRTIVNACAFDPTGGRFAVASASGMSICDLQTADTIKYVDTRLHAKSLLWSSDGKRLFLGDEGGKMGIWNAEDYSHVATIDAEKGPILRMFFSMNQSRLYTSTDWGGMVDIRHNGR